MLTARGQEVDKVLGLKMGADDYITKPFGFMELMARVEAVLRRATGGEGMTESYQFGDVHVNFKRFEAKKKGKSLDLSPREFRLLHYFVEHRGEVVPRDQLLDTVWGHDASLEPRTVDVHIRRLRKALNGPGESDLIRTVRTAGYALETPGDA